MRGLSITQRLMVAVVSASIAGVIAMGLATQFAFQRSFLEYINDVGRDKLEQVLPRAAALYERSGSWDYLRAHPRAWLAAVGIPDTDPGAIPAGNAPFAPGNIDVTGTALRITLLDADRRFLIGWPAYRPEALRRAITVQGANVGYLVLDPLREVTTAAEQRFQRRQGLLTSLIGALAVLGAAGVGAWLARAFLHPIQGVADTARRLTRADYTARAAVRSTDELGRLAADINHLAQTLERTEAQRRTLMADVSHELRTPLSILRAELEALDDGVRRLTPDSLRSLLSEVAVLGKLVADLHELALADVGGLSYRYAPLAVGAVLAGCAEVFRERLQARGLTLTVALDAPAVLVRADEMRLQQVFNNLLENALRHTDAPGTVALRCWREGEEVCIDIEDSAPGVPAALLAQLFTRFFRADPSRSRHTGGSGLGMAISRGIVDAHRGSISAGASPLGGLRVSIRLPIIGIA